MQAEPAGQRHAAEPSKRIAVSPWMLASLALSMMLAALGTSAANVGLPTLTAAFDASFQDVQWVVLAYLLSVTTLVVGAGRLGDKIGRRRVLLGGLLLFSLASLACGIAPTLPLLIAGRVMQGAGAAVMMTLSMALVGNSVAKSQTGRAMGLLATMSAVGTAAGPTLGGVLIAWAGWRAIFLVNVPLGILTLLVALRSLPGDRPRATSANVVFDGMGTLLLATTLGAYGLAMTIGQGRFGALNAALASLALVSLSLFAFVETKVSSPLVRPAMMHDPVLRAGLLSSALVSTVIMGTLVVGPFYLTRTLGLAPVAVGAVLSIGPIVAALAGMPSGRLSERFGPQHTAVFGLAGMAAGCLLLSITRAAWGIPGYVASVVVITAFYALFQTANNTAVLENVAPDERGVVSGMLNLSRNLGLVTGASAMGAVFSAAAGPEPVAHAGPEAVAAGLTATLALGAILVALGLTVALMTGPRRPE